ncbi:unnamed protein product [Cladocopium goreaui]|uniref:Uncharacterized protein n=1 Tax=Cladocopium goreaui TaxID=2562237 RepID=A0A9P1CYZ7_9DINO|nr:unnamed protein product [Cladocopium goreaui]
MEFVHVDAMSCLQVPSMQVVPQESILPYHRWFLRLQGPIHPKLQRQNYSYVSGLFIRPSLANASHPVSIRQESFLKVLTPFTAKNRTAILRAVVSLDRWSDSLGGRLGAPYADTFYLDDSRIVPEAAEETTPVDVMPQLGNRLKIVPWTWLMKHFIQVFSLRTGTADANFHGASASSPQRHCERFGLGNPSELNPLLADARCACGIWTLLAMAFIGYLSVATISFGESLQLPDQEDVYEVERQLPPVWIRLCELAALQAAINYSIFDHLVAKGRVNYVLPNGTEESFGVDFNVSQPEIFRPTPDFRCKRFSLNMRMPEEALMPYHVFEVGIQEPFHSKLSAMNGLYTRGLFFGPSLAENATNPHACQEEHLLKMWVPSSKLPGLRNVVMNVAPSQALWSDSLGGRQGAPCDDTHFFADISMVPEATVHGLDTKKFENQSVTARATLRMVVPISHQEIQVFHFHNDLVANTLSYIGKLVSATVIFKLMVSIFPQIRQKRYHFLTIIPWLSLGYESLEFEPLIDKSLP